MNQAANRFVRQSLVHHHGQIGQKKGERQKDGMLALMKTQCNISHIL